MPSATKTIKHDTIRRGAEERDGQAAILAALRASDQAEILRIDVASAGLGPSSWERFFETLARFQHAFPQHQTESGQASRFLKLGRRN